jgi:hypothetical protein
MGRFGQVQRRAQGFVGLLTLACGFFMMWGSARGSVDESATQRRLRDEVVSIDALLPSGTHNGALVLAAQKLASPELIEDEFLKPGPYLIIRRHVEMYQWIEQSAAVGGDPEYKLQWHEGQVDFFGFQKPQGHENPLLRVEPLIRSVSVSTFGAFDASVLLRSVRILSPLELAPEKLKDSTLAIVDNKIVLPRSPNSAGGTALGDMRVWYEVLPQGEYTVLTRQLDERNLVGATPSEGMVMRRGLLTADQFFVEETSQTRQVADGLLYIGGFLFFAGLVSVLSPMAGRLSLRPKFPVDGMPAVVVVSAGLSLVAVSIFFVLGRLG